MAAARQFLRRPGTSARWLVIGLTVGIALGMVVTLAAPRLVRAAPPTGPSAYPLWCGDPDPQVGWTYGVDYSASNGTIQDFGGASTTWYPTTTPGMVSLIIGPSSFANQTLIHSMYCWVEQGHSGGFLFHVDLATHEVVWPGVT